MHHFLKGIYFPLIVSIITAHAQVENLPKVTVRAAKRKSYVKHLSQTKIGLEEIQQRAEPPLSEWVKTVPGVHVVQNGGPGHPVALFIRGTEANHTLVLLDGMRFIDPSTPTGAVDIALFSTDVMESITVQRGVLSSLYGSQAIGGVLSLETRRGTSPTTLSFRGEGGSFGSDREVLSYSAHQDHIRAFLSLRRWHTMGNTSIPRRYRPPGFKMLNQTALQESLGSRWDFGKEDNLLSLIVNRFEGRGAFGVNEEKWWGYQSSSYYRLKHHWADHPQWSVDGGLGYFQTDRNYINAVGLEGGASSGSFFACDLAPKWTISASDQLSMRADYQAQQFSTHQETALLKSRQHHGGVGIQYDKKIEKWLFSLAGRLDHMGQTAPTGRFSFERAVDNSVFKGSFGTGFRSPTLSQLYYNTPYFKGNPHLKPERSYGWEVGYGHRFFKRLTLEATLFDTLLTDLITVSGTTYENRKRAQLRGAELYANYDILPSLKLNLTYTFTRARDQLTGHQLLRRPRHRATASLEWSPTEKMRIFVRGLLVGARPDNNTRSYPPQAVQLGSVTTFDVEAHYQFSKSLQTYCKINNLLNKQYEDPAGYRQWGFNFLIGLKGHFTL